MHDADLLAGVSGDSGLLLLSVRLARTAWILFTLAILLASDLPYVVSPTPPPPHTHTSNQPCLGFFQALR